MNITILGAGAFGTAMSKHLASLGCDVLLWTIDESQCNGINKDHRNPLCFQETELPSCVRCTLDICEALDFSDRVIMALPTQVEREVCEKVSRSGRKGLHMLNLSKGIEISTGALLHEIHDELLPDFKYSALSGPSFAAEVLEEKPTTVALASRIAGEAESWQKIVSGGSFRVYTSDDVVGLEVGGATKNIYAVAAGIAEAMKLGRNAQAALICRGLAEMMRFGQRMGAQPSRSRGWPALATSCSPAAARFRATSGWGSPSAAAKSLTRQSRLSDRWPKVLIRCAQWLRTAKSSTSKCLWQRVSTACSTAANRRKSCCRLSSPDR